LELRSWKDPRIFSKLQQKNKLKEMMLLRKNRWPTLLTAVEMAGNVPRTCDAITNPFAPLYIL
jgi:hypothetical protein